MLVLVLLPLACAMDSEDAFYQEYDCGDDEGFIEEYGDWEVEYTPEDASSEIEIDNCEESDNDNCYKYYDGSDQDQVEEDAKEIPELNIDSVDVTPYIDNPVIIVEEEHEDISSEVFDNMAGNVEETSDDELTFSKKISVNQGSIFISIHDSTITVDIINHIVNEGRESCKMSKLNNDLVELKNNLLINQDLKTVHSNDIVIDDLYNILIGIDYTSNDFAYSIDNSIIGDAINKFFTGTFSCFLNYVYPCFDASFSCDFLIDEYYFYSKFVGEYDFCGGCCMIAADFFGDFVVDFNKIDLTSIKLI